MTAPRRKPKPRTCWLVMESDSLVIVRVYASHRLARATFAGSPAFRIVRATYTLPKPRRGER